MSYTIRPGLTIKDGHIPTLLQTSDEIDYFYYGFTKTCIDELIAAGVLPATPGFNMRGIAAMMVDVIEAARARTILLRVLAKGGTVKAAYAAIHNPKRDSATLTKLLRDFAIGVAWSRPNWKFTNRELPGFTPAAKFRSEGRAIAALNAYAAGKGKN